MVTTDLTPEVRHGLSFTRGLNVWIRQADLCYPMLTALHGQAEK